VSLFNTIVTLVSQNRTGCVSSDCACAK